MFLYIILLAALKYKEISYKKSRSGLLGKSEDLIILDPHSHGAAMAGDEQQLGFLGEA